MAAIRGKGVQGLLSENWEKMVLALVVLAALGLVVMSFTRGRAVDLTPDQLTSMAAQAEQNFQRTEPAPTREVPGYSEVAKRIKEAVSSTGYQLAAPFDPPLFAQLEKRGQPEVFPVTGLKASAGHGAVAGADPATQRTTAGAVGYPGGTGSTGYGSTGPMGAPPMPVTTGEDAYGSEYAGYGMAGYGGYSGGATHGRRWVVVTGLIEWEKQIQAFRDVLQNAVRVPGMAGGASSAMGYGTAMPTGYPGAGSGYESEYGSDMGGYPGASGNPGSGAGAYGTAAAALGERPQYVYYNIERAEITDEDQPADALQWEAINARVRWAEASRIQRDGFNYVGPEYVMPPGQVPLTWPLAQLAAGDSWGPEVAHDPEIPFVERPRTGMGGMYGGYGMYGGEMSGSVGPMGSGGVMPTAMPPRPGAPGAATAPGGPGRPGAGTQPPAPEIPDAPIDPTQMRPGAPGMMPGYGASPYGTSAPYGAPPGYPGMAGSAESEYSEYGYGPPGGAIPLQAAMKEAPLKLFRFVDYQVEPGKKYRYRVRLYLTNPNYRIPPQYLQDEKFAQDPFLITAWSDPSNMVRVPADVSVLAGPAKPGRIPTSEPRITLGVTVFQPGSGRKKFQEFADLLRGAVVDFTAEEVKKLTPPKKETTTATASPYPMESMYSEGYEGAMPGRRQRRGGGSTTGSAEMGSTPGSTTGYPMAGQPPGYGELGYGETGYGMGGPAAAKPEPELDFFSRMMILDISGGETLPTKAAFPASVVLVDPEGNLFVRDEIADEAEYKRFTEPQTPYGGGYGYPMTGSGYESEYGAQYGSYMTGEAPGGRTPRRETGSARSTGARASQPPAGYPGASGPPPGYPGAAPARGGRRGS
ncbi:MAG: hypothetical protein ACUVTW_15430 [Thermogutta sp.]